MTNGAPLRDRADRADRVWQVDGRTLARRAAGRGRDRRRSGWPARCSTRASQRWTRSSPGLGRTCSGPMTSLDRAALGRIVFADPARAARSRGDRPSGRPAKDHGGDHGGRCPGRKHRHHRGDQARRRGLDRRVRRGLARHLRSDRAAHQAHRPWLAPEDAEQRIAGPGRHRQRGSGLRALARSTQAERRRQPGVLRRQPSMRRAARAATSAATVSRQPTVGSGMPGASISRRDCEPTTSREGAPRALLGACRRLPVADGGPSERGVWLPRTPVRFVLDLLD